MKKGKVVWVTKKDEYGINILEMGVVSQFPFKKDKEKDKDLVCVLTINNEYVFMDKRKLKKLQKGETKITVEIKDLCHRVISLNSIIHEYKKQILAFE